MPKNFIIRTPNTPKLNPPFSGTYEIIEKLSNVSFRINKSNSLTKNNEAIQASKLGTFCLMMTNLSYKNHVNHSIKYHVNSYWQTNDPSNLQFCIFMSRLYTTLIKLINLDFHYIILDSCKALLYFLFKLLYFIGIFSECPAFINTNVSIMFIYL